MTDLFLVAHKVRGLPAFDIAHRMTCRVCQEFGDDFGPGCHECDSLGYWWIISTSGHRAYPIISWPLSALRTANYDGAELNELICEHIASHPMWPNLPDHYPHRAEPNRDLVSLLGLIHRPLAPIKRRL